MSDMTEVAEAALERVRGRRLQLVTTEHVCSPADLATLRTIIATYDAALRAAEALVEAVGHDAAIEGMSCDTCSARNCRNCESDGEGRHDSWEPKERPARFTAIEAYRATREAIDTVRGEAL